MYVPSREALRDPIMEGFRNFKEFYPNDPKAINFSYFDVLSFIPGN